jgi:hypothetical protein
MDPRKILKTMHCHLCINYLPQTYPPTHTHSLAGSVTILAKTTEHCSPNSSMTMPNLKYSKTDPKNMTRKVFPTFKNNS